MTNRDKKFQAKKLLGKNILWLASNPSMVVQFYLPHLRNLVAAGARVSLATNFNGAADKKKLLEKIGVACFSLPVQRGGKNILAEIKTILAIHRFIRRQRPDMINALALKMVLYGGLVARWQGVRFLGSLTGLGFIFISNQPFARLVRLGLRFVLPFIFAPADKKLLVMNHDDLSLMRQRFFIKQKNIVLMLGVGVDDDYFRGNEDLPTGKKNKKTIITMARLLRDKGIVEFCQAAKLVRQEWRDVDFLIYGARDGENPSALSLATISDLKKCGVVFMGYTADSRRAIARADAVALLSYREGLPQVLLEASAMGKCLLALDAPGSREVCRNGVSGLLVAKNDPAMIATAMKKILGDAPLRNKLGRGARQLVRDKFSLRIIEQQMLALWQGFF
ncbi:MAG: glycosyltransferase family 4 protein [Hydrotalea sp.]|nr:glycosyltransferase family 4 protein [Hydrotalea sp.]